MRISNWLASLFQGSISNSARGRQARRRSNAIPFRAEYLECRTLLTGPTVVSPTATNVTSTIETLGGNVTSNGGSILTGVGVVYSLTSTNNNPTLNVTGVMGLQTAPSVGIFTVDATGLTSGVSYSYAAYATNLTGTTYTSVGTFTIPVPAVAPTVTSPTSTNVTTTTATLGGDVTSDGGGTLTEVGVLYALTSTNNNPTLSGTGVTNLASSSSTGIFTVNAMNLTPDTSYSYVAYASNSVGTTYTSAGTFTTLVPAVAPTITSPTSTNVATTTATLGGNVTSDGGSSLTSVGVVFSLTGTNSNPTVGGTGVTNLASTLSTGLFTVFATSLTSGASYSYAAYATNSIGTTYTTVGTFTTPVPAVAPTVTSPTSANVTSTLATLGGNVTSDGGSSLTAVGVVYSLTDTNNNPTVGGTGVTNLASTLSAGVFTVLATSLTPGASYSYAAYAKNSIGTTYTSVGAFSTPATTQGPVIGGLSASTTYTKGSAPVSFAPSLTITDSSVANLTSATVTITNWNTNGNGEDSLTFSNTAALTNALVVNSTTHTAVLTLTGTATVAAYQAELRSLKYQNLNFNNPLTLARSVTIAVTDTSTVSGSGTTAISVMNTNLPPSITSFAGSQAVAYTPNTPAVPITSTALVNDPDSPTLSKLTVQITSGYVSGADTLNFVNQNGITGSFNAMTGMLTLTGNVAPGYYRIALRSVTFSSSSTSNTTSSRTLTAVAYDNNNLASTSALDTVQVGITSITGPGASGLPSDNSVNYVIGSGKIPIAPNVELTDLLGRTITSATVTITNWVPNEDRFSFYNSGALTNTTATTSNTLTLTLTKNASLAAYQSDLQSMMYQDLAGSPVLTPRSVTISFTDSSSANYTSPAISISLQNAPPVVSLGATTLAYTANSAAVPIASSATVTDSHTSVLSKMTITITNGYQSGDDSLNFVNQNGITGVYSAGVLTLTGKASVTNYQTALRSVTFDSAGTSVSTAARTLSVVAYDSSTPPVTSTSSTLGVTVSAGAPTPLSLTGVTASQTYTPGMGTMKFATNLVLADNVGLGIVSATVTITNWVPNEDRFAFYNSGALTNSTSITTNTLTLTLTAPTTLKGAASLTAFKNDLQSMTYQDLAGAPVTTARVVTIKVTDSNGATATATTSISVA